MDLSVEDFRARFPEFNSADVPLVGIKLAEAHRMFDRELFGDLYIDAVAYKTAELLAMSPYGKHARLSEKTAETTYAVVVRDICSKVPARFL